MNGVDLLAIKERDGIEVRTYEGAMRFGRVVELNPDGTISYAARDFCGNDEMFWCHPSQVMAVYDCCPHCYRDECVCKPDTDDELNGLSDYDRNPSLHYGPRQ
jgi:hypothetical protein